MKALKKAAKAIDRASVRNDISEQRKASQGIEAQLKSKLAALPVGILATNFTRFLNEHPTTTLSTEEKDSKIALLNTLEAKKQELSAISETVRKLAWCIHERDKEQPDAFASLPRTDNHVTDCNNWLAQIRNKVDTEFNPKYAVLEKLVTDLSTELTTLEATTAAAAAPTVTAPLIFSEAAITANPGVADTATAQPGDFDDVVVIIGREAPKP
jgi:hypothetical protein